MKYLGISEASAEEIRRAHAVHPISACQLEWSIWTRDVEVGNQLACTQACSGNDGNDLMAALRTMPSLRAVVEICVTFKSAGSVLLRAVQPLLALCAFSEHCFEVLFVLILTGGDCAYMPRAGHWHCCIFPSWPRVPDWPDQVSRLSVSIPSLDC